MWAFLRSATPLLAGLAFFVTFAVQAQDGSRQRRVGVLNEAWAANHPTVEGLRAGLRDLGFSEGKEVVFDIRFTQGKPEATPAAAAELVKAGVDVIFTSSEAATQAARGATKTIPIVFTAVGDPVAAGMLKSIAKPGENITGISSLSTHLAAKRLELLTTLAPHVRRVWAIYYRDDPSSVEAVRRAEAAAKLLKVELLARPASTAAEVSAAVKAMGPGDALLPPDVATLDIPATLLEVSINSRIPAVFSTALWVDHGALASYGPDYYAEGIQAARLVAKVLRGARPGDLPVEDADRIDFAINVKTATVLGLAIPRKLLLRADTIRR